MSLGLPGTFLVFTLKGPCLEDPLNPRQTRHPATTPGGGCYNQMCFKGEETEAPRAFCTLHTGHTAS